MSNPKTPYELETSFDRQALELPHGRRKAHLFAALTPDDCSSILDAGGGTGWATVELRKGRDIVTLDSSSASLAYAEGKTVIGDVDNLPFEDNSFDMVLSSQVLEHLPDDVFQRATAEMNRVARHYLMVSVPYREVLGTRLVRCKACNHTFHPDYHCRAFTERDLAASFPGWIMAEWHVFGALRWAVGVDPFKPNQRGTRHSKLPAAPESTICPKCGEQGSKWLGDETAAKEGLIQRVVDRSKARLSKVIPALTKPKYPTFLPQNISPYWIVAVFIREGGTPIDNPNVGMTVHD